MTKQRGRGKGLSHLDGKGRLNMVDVSAKPERGREAVAEATILMKAETLRLITSGKAGKGDVFAAARIAGIQAAKKTPELIPLCHPLLLGRVQVEFDEQSPVRGRAALRVRAAVRAAGRTGVEMEALCAASVAAMTVYDMCKAVDRWMTITGLRLLSKKGGASGTLGRPGIKRG